MQSSLVQRLFDQLERGSCALRSIRQSRLAGYRDALSGRAMIRLNPAPIDL